MSYISKLSKKEIIKFLKNNNLKPTVLYNEDGEELPSIERNSTAVFIRCTKIEGDDVDKLIKSFNLFWGLGDPYADNTIALFLKDFEITALCFPENEEFSERLNDNWIDFMNDKFGNQYKLDLINEFSQPNYNFEK